MNPADLWMANAPLVGKAPKAVKKAPEAVKKAPECRRVPLEARPGVPRANGETVVVCS